MAGGTGSSGFLVVSLVAREATEPFMDTHWSTIVARSHFHCGQRCVALVAQGLTAIWTDFDASFAIVHRGQRQPFKGHVVQFAPVK